MKEFRMSAPMEKIPPTQRLITVEEYYRMAEIGLLKPDSRVELIEGAIIDMAPIGPRHNSALYKLTRWFTLAVGEQAIVGVGSSIRLSNITEPQPDLLLLKPRADFYSSRIATTEDTLLVVEVSDTTLSYDRKVKVPLYARYGVPEVWIVDVEGSCLHCFRARANAAYNETRTTASPGVIAVPGLGGVTVNLSYLFQPAE
jgi:Uma2 family endonuclease